MTRTLSFKDCTTRAEAVDLFRAWCEEIDVNYL
jgi:hypothetical protein